MPEILHKQVYESDLVLNGNQIMTLENIHIIVNGDIFLLDVSQLILRQSILEYSGHFYLQDSAILQADTTIFGYANPGEEIDPEKAEMFKGGILYADNYSQVKMNNCFSQTQFFSGNSEIIITDSYLILEPLGIVHVEGSTDVLIDNSYVGAILLDIPQNTHISIDNLVPGYFEYWSVRDEISDSIPYNLILRKTDLAENSAGYIGGMELGWNIALNAFHSDVMISNSILNKIIIEFPQNEPAFFSDLTIREPADFDLNNIHVRNTEVQTQWGVFMNGGPAEIINSEGVWIFMSGGNSDIIVHNSDVGEIDPRNYTGNLIFENSTWQSGYEIWENSEIKIRGSVRMLSTVPIFDSTSVMTRYYDVYLINDLDGTPFSNIGVRLLKDKELVWSGSTDEAGKVVFTIDYNLNNFDDTWELTTNDENIDLKKAISIYISNPVMISLEPLTDGIHYRNVMHVEKGNPGFPLGTRESPYTNIQEAIDNSGGDIIYVHPGIYRGNVEPGKVNATINLKDSIQIMADHPDSTIIDASIFAENINGANLSGFTILDVIQSRYSSLKLVNNVIRGNTETAIWATHSNLEIINNTIAYNYSDAIFLHDSCTVAIRNNIISNNSNWGITGHENVETIIDYNNIWGNGGNYFEFFQPGDNDISEDPLYVNASENIFHLKPGSPCIDAGDPDPGFNDIDGSRNDMGAFSGYYLIETITGIKERSEIETEGIIYPNPFTNSISLNVLQKDLPATITLFTLNGRLVYSSKLDIPSINLNMTPYKNGVYILNISSSSRNYSFKIIKN